MLARRGDGMIPGGVYNVGCEGVRTVMSIDRYYAVISRRTKRVIEDRVNRVGFHLKGFIGNLCHGLINVNHCSVRRSEPHWEGAACKIAGVLGPTARWIIVVRRVEPDAMAKFDLCLGHIVTPDRAMRSLR